MTLEQLLRIDADSYKNREESKVYREVRKADGTKTLKVIYKNRVAPFAEEAYFKACGKERARRGVIREHTGHRKRNAQWGAVFVHRTYKVTVWLEYGC